MILIADSGSTKTDWCLAGPGKPFTRLQTKGINPFYQTEEEITKEIEKELIPQLPQDKIDAVFFYGAGCAFPDKIAMVQQAIERIIPGSRVEVGSDLLGAARALCGTTPGIACIMGTGSNSCQYDGTQIVKNVSPLGFILGDEGSGAVLGKLLVADLLKGCLPKHIRDLFYQQSGLTPAVIMDRVYKQSFPNRFLAGLSPFILQHLQEPTLKKIVYTSFRDFFTRNVMQYDYSTYPVHLTGSIAFYYKEIVEEVANELGITIGHIEKSPMLLLMAYHKLSIYW
ncbi:MAG: ATPase [Tannerellaceae bacterium]|nr:ATPase [Tannerellaceae bacterium]MCD8265454.1 ATPase [Tannerellaceae bacterium]